MRTTSKWQRPGLFLVLAILAAVAACSGGTNPTFNYPSTTGGIIGAGTYTVNAVNGVNSTVNISGSGTVTVSGSAQAPSVGAIPSAVRRATASSPNQALIYYTVTATSTATIKTLSISVGFAQAPTTSVYLAYWNGTQWVANSTPGAYASGAVTVTLPSSATPILLASGQSLYLVVYQGQQIGTPPPPAPVASPSSLQMSEGTQQTVTVTSRSGQTLTASSSDTTIVTVSPASTAVPASGSVTFTLTAADKAGTATVTFTDSIGQKGTVTVTTSNTFPSPVPAPSVATVGIGGTLSVAITTQPNSTVTASSSNTAVATVPASAQASSTGSVTFTVTAAGPGSATITFTDTFGNTGTLQLFVSAVKNGAFANGLTNWTNCSYAHTALTAAVNESTPIPESPMPTQSPGAATTPIPAGNLTGLSAAVTPPPNDNPSPPAGVTVGTVPGVLGTSVALVGTINSLTVASPKGEFGICQQVTVPSAGFFLTFWEWEGNTEFTFKDADEDAVVLDSTGTNVLQTLFVENHCYADPLIGQAPGQATTSGCWPAAYGGDSSHFLDWIGGGFWTQRGPYDLSAFAGQTITLYFGNWSFFANNANKFANFIYVGNVQLIPSSAFPGTTATDAMRRYTVTMHRR